MMVTNNVDDGAQHNDDGAQQHGIGVQQYDAGGVALLLDAASHDTTINLLKDHLRRTAPIRYTGRLHDSNRLARIQPLYISFVLAHLPYLHDTYGYRMTPGKTVPGVKACIFGPFRDIWLPHALRELRAESLGVPVDKVDTTAYLVKRNQRLNNNAPCMQAIIGWEFTPDDAGVART